MHFSFYKTGISEAERGFVCNLCVSLAHGLPDERCIHVTVVGTFLLIEFRKVTILGACDRVDCIKGRKMHQVGDALDRAIRRAEGFEKAVQDAAPKSLSDLTSK